MYTISHFVFILNRCLNKKTFVQTLFERNIAELIMSHPVYGKTGTLYKKKLSYTDYIINAESLYIVLSSINMKMEFRDLIRNCQNPFQFPLKQ